jgi:hypothetical protein
MTLNIYGIEQFNIDGEKYNDWRSWDDLYVDRGAAQAPISTLNFVAGQTVANGALVPLTDGNACVTGSTDSQYIFDVTGILA